MLLAFIVLKVYDLYNKLSSFVIESVHCFLVND